MRKSQKKQIEDMLAMLDRAHEAIRKAVETGKRDIALSLLEQCQEIAIQMGEMLEDSFGEDFATVGMLESYCERIYQTYESLQQQKSVNAGKIYKSIRKELIRIENSIKNDIVVRTVAVFLPYKASMWDSLESVWQAADADPNCDAYVIPIPYFDKNPDGSFREMQYEGNEYPKYVPITSWQEYDIAKEHPDKIFIHNPYDEFNIVTSVHPSYYAKELRKHTDQLVYIPYFILGEIEPDNAKAVEGIEHFCAVPAVAYADKVIVQSEKMRQIYIDVMSKTMGRDTRKIWEKKILGLGSPKIDRVQSTQNNELEIPKDWLKVIEKPDGSRKKIILYNTSVSALLQHSEKMLQKLMYVFHIFKENQDEVALLWRPHPLIKATIESMRPQLWIEYDKLVRQYREESWGIYDDTTDVDRAIVLSDAYYGDPSSLVRMYKETGKPIMLQAVENFGQETGENESQSEQKLAAHKLELNFLAGVQVGNVIYFSAWDRNGLFKYNPQTGQCNFLKSFPGEEKWGLHSEAILYRNTIWFIPRASERIAIVDLEDLNIMYLELPECGYRPKGLNIPPRRIIGSHERGEKFLWLIPFAYRLFIKIDMDERKIVEVQEWSTDDFVRAMAVRVQNKLWVSIKSTKEIRVIDLESGEQFINKMEHKDIGCYGIQNISGKIVSFSPHMRDGVVIWDYDMHEEKIAHLDDHEQTYYEYQALTEENDILLIPYFGNQSIRIRLEGDHCFIKECKDLEMEENAYCSVKMPWNDQIWFLSHAAERPIICYDKQEEAFCYRHIVMGQRKYHEDVAEAFIKYGREYTPWNLGEIIYESLWPLNRFLFFIKGARYVKKVEEEEQIGNSIYKALA